MDILYWGYNSFNDHKRGVENVIDFQSNSYKFNDIYYFHWGENNKIYKSKKFICVSIKNNWYWPIVFNLLLFRIKRSKNVLIHSHNPIFTFFSVFKTNLLTVHDGLYYLAKENNHTFKYFLYLIEYITYFRCEYVHFISEFSMKQTLFRRRSNFKIIPNTSHFEPFFNSSFTKSNLITTPKINVLIVRSIEERSRFDLLIDLAKNLTDSNFYFNVVGKGPLLKYYQEISKYNNLQNICFHGYMNDDNLVKSYVNCDIVLLIAEYGEGFGLPIIEGYLFNKPVIASNKCAIPEIIISKEFLFENNLDSISNALIRHSNCVKSNFREYYDSKYSNQLIYSIFNELYTKLSLK